MSSGQRDSALLTRRNAKGRFLPALLASRRLAPSCGCAALWCAHARCTPLSHQHPTHTPCAGLLGGGGGTDGPRRARPLASIAGKRSAADCEREAADALAAIAARQHKFLLCGRNQSALDSIVAELEQYLTELDNPGRDTWATCTDLEVLVFLEAHYLRNHDGAYGGDVAPGTLTKAVSTLRRAFNMRHRGGSWISEPGLGATRQPCDSLAIAIFRFRTARPRRRPAFTR